jgi:L-lactate utilization protein LutB
MPRINAAPIDMIWVHMSMSGVNLASLKGLITSALQGNNRTAHCQPSVNVKADGTEALCKVPATPSWVNTLPPPMAGNVITTYTDATFGQAFTLVHAPGWQPS